MLVCDICQNVSDMMTVSTYYLQLKKSGDVTAFHLDDLDLCEKCKHRFTDSLLQKLLEINKEFKK